jgi:hypothetical protein
MDMYKAYLIVGHLAGCNVCAILKFITQVA